MLPESITAQAVRSIDEPVAKEWISLLLETGLISVSKALEGSGSVIRNSTGVEEAALPSSSIAIATTS